jgi:hypothetical protein
MDMDYIIITPFSGTVYNGSKVIIIFDLFYKKNNKWHLAVKTMSFRTINVPISLFI